MTYVYQDWMYYTFCEQNLDGQYVINMKQVGVKSRTDLFNSFNTM